MRMIRNIKENYHVNEEKKVVVCVLTAQIGIEPEKIENVTIVRKAKCDDKDTFDIELGKKIAKCRAMEKLMRKTLSYVRNQVEKHFHKVNLYTDAGFKYSDAIKREMEYCGKLIF